MADEGGGGNELFNNPRREESPRSPRLWGLPARPSSAGAPQSPSPRPVPGSAWGCGRGPGASCLCLRLSDHLSEALAQVKTRGRRRGAPLAGNQRVPALRDPPAPCPPRLPLGSTPGARASPGFSELRSAWTEAGASRGQRAGPGSGSAREAAAGPPRPGRAGDWPRCLPSLLPRNARSGRGLAASLTILHQGVKCDRRSPEPVLRTWSLARAYQRHRGSGDNPRRRARLRDPAQDAAGGLPAPGHERQSQAGAFRGAAIRASERRDVAAPGPRENRLSQPFQSAHNKCARHRMHHLPPQIRAPMGRQIAVRGGRAGRPVPRRQPACPPAGGTRV
ncbi:unnamed protein product [Nyctereutes procyonoides]|uniref:(raccoon dog) hypothetical protein n=1 Tax=Nyctereutes procyonoides TaxID=34880 RepID=A0A811Z8R7_NYCPR|nr:unnamed protein product [Nyctereutes procyonoides]